MDKDNLLEQKNKIFQNNGLLHTPVHKLLSDNYRYVEISMNVNNIPRPILTRNNHYWLPENISNSVINNTKSSNNICDILFAYNRNKNKYSS